MSTLGGDIMSALGGGGGGEYYGYIFGCSIHWGFQYKFLKGFIN